MGLTSKGAVALNGKPQSNGSAAAAHSVRPRYSGSGAAAIEAKDLVKVYPGGVRALDGLGFTVEAGIVFALLGPNGAGKSTTVKILNTLSRPTQGSALVAGFDVQREPERVRLSIGCVSQKSTVDVWATGRENLTLQGQLYGLRGRELNNRVNELLERFSLTHAADKLGRTYSGGMQRKLDIAMGLIHRPRVLFLDEPTAGLDPESRAGLWREIARLGEEDGTTVLLTTHYLDEADHLAHRLAIIDRGKMVAEGTPEELKGELSGDSVHVELAQSELGAQARQRLEQLQGVREVVLNGSVLHAVVARGATAVPTILAALESGGMRVSSVKVTRASLDDVYLKHTGRTFGEVSQRGGR